MKLTEIGGPYGDQTSSFTVTEYQAKTVAEFVNEVLEQFPDEWGYIDVKTEVKRTFLDFVEYRYGKLLYEIPREWRDKEIKKIDARGGWSRMDYIIHIKPIDN